MQTRLVFLRAITADEIACATSPWSPPESSARRRGKVLMSEPTDRALCLDDLDDLRIRAIRPLVPSACLIDEAPADASVYETVTSARKSLSQAVRGLDSRLVVICGPASVHDYAATIEYAHKLRDLAERLKGELIIVMRVFLDEPAGGAGYWSGAMYDPELDGTFQINKGFKQARQLLLEINKLGLPCGCLYLDTISPQFVADLVSWSTISSRTSESFLHRELASGLSTPVGFQTVATGGDAAERVVDAVRMSAAPHAFLSVSKQGVAGIVETSGNRDCHVLLPPGAEAIQRAKAKLEALELPARVMVECQSAADVASIASGVSAGERHVFGCMLPSFLLGGAQLLQPGDKNRKYGMSVTSPCMDWTSTVTALEGLSAAVTARRQKSVPTPKREESVTNLKSFLEQDKDLGDNLRVRRIRSLLPPACCLEELEADAEIKQLVFQTRCDISGLLHSGSDGVRADDGRLLVIVGPPVVHDPKAAMEYASRLRSLAAEHADELLVVMNVSFEDTSSVPTGGWKGLINDPRLDGSLQINEGLRAARQLLLAINRLGLPTSYEYLDTITPQFVADLVSWAMVGERTCASRSHRELASGLSTPVGFQKGAPFQGKDERIAVDAVRASAAPHAFLSVSKQGVAGIVETTGNRDCHVVLPPGDLASSLGAEGAALRGLSLPTRLMVHCCAPSGVKVSQAPAAISKAVHEVAALLGSGAPEAHGLLGVLLPSFLLSGRQDMVPGQPAKAYGMSVTEPCLDWAATAEALGILADAARQRHSPAKKPRRD